MIIAIDFDGTIVEHKYPAIGQEIPFATDTLKLLQRDGHRLILWTVREGALLEEAVAFCRARGVEFFAVNSDSPTGQADNSTFRSRKIKADLFIDDRQVGGLPDWGVIYELIRTRTKYTDYLQNTRYQTSEHSKQRTFWSRMFGK